MKFKYSDPNGNFTDDQVTQVVALFTSMRENNLAPVCIYAIRKDGMPCAIFNAILSNEAADLVGESIGYALEVVEFSKSSN